MSKKLSDDFVNNKLMVFGMESEEKNQEIKNAIVESINSDLNKDGGTK